MIETKFYDFNGERIREGDIIGKDGKPYYKIYINDKDHICIDAVGNRDYRVSLEYIPTNLSLSRKEASDLSQWWIIDCMFVIMTPGHITPILKSSGNPDIDALIAKKKRWEKKDEECFRKKNESQNTIINIIKKHFNKL